MLITYHVIYPGKKEVLLRDLWLETLGIPYWTYTLDEQDLEMRRN